MKNKIYKTFQVTQQLNGLFSLPTRRESWRGSRCLLLSDSHRGLGGGPLLPRALLPDGYRKVSQATLNGDPEAKKAGARKNRAVSGRGGRAVVHYPSSCSTKAPTELESLTSCARRVGVSRESAGARTATPGMPRGGDAGRLPRACAPRMDAAG